jgi:protein TonB
MAKVISEAAPRQQEKMKPIEPVIEKTRLETPPPEIFIASDAPAPVAQIATHAAPTKEEPVRQVVDSQPKFDADYLDNPAPVYPKLSKSRREEGKVQLLVHVLADGLPDEIKIKHSSGSERLDQSALATVKRWKFVPATSGGSPVAAWVVVPLEFSLNG